MAAATLLEPLLIVGLAVVVLLIMLAVLMPIMQLKPWVRCGQASPAVQTSARVGVGACSIGSAGAPAPST